jgi:ATP-dependent RNA helicase DeaD
MVSPFEALGLQAQFVQVVEQMGFEQPTPIQQSAIPALLDGRNVVGQAQTGTGKTAAFALPMLQQIQPGSGAIQALVLAPTRELAIQVAEATGRLARNTSLRVMVVYGGQSYQIQIRQLERGVDVVVGTPGRLLDLIRKNLLDLSQVRYLVLDEADEMLEMGFIEDVETILAQIPQERQTALFSATLPPAVRKLANRYLSNPYEITINPARLTVAETEQRYYRVRMDQKLPALTRLLELDDVTSALIFTRTKVGAQELADELNRRGCPAESLHGDLNQARRESILNRFRRHTIKLLVATDVAARGLDIENVSHVFNYDVPEDAEDYVHRIGRTGRAGRKGIAITFFTPRERSRLGQIEAYTRQKLSECRIPSYEAVLAHRDERFLQSLTEQLGKGTISHERALIARLTETSFDLVEIAAAAIKLARAGEAELPREEIIEPAAEPRSARTSARKPAAWDNARPDRSGRGASKNPGRSKGSWKDVESSQPQWSERQAEAGMVRLRMNLGDTHGLRPGDVVGAIASEVGIPGKAIGEIDIRKDFTFVDVSEKHVRQVLKESSGQYNLRGKPVMLTLAS